MLTDDKRHLLEVEAQKGEDWQRVWETYLSPFFRDKQQDLFLAFQELSTTDSENLLAIKMQSNALKSLADEFITIIDTGKMARQTLNEENENG